MPTSPNISQTSPNSLWCCYVGRPEAVTYHRPATHNPSASFPHPLPKHATNNQTANGPKVALQHIKLSGPNESYGLTNEPTRLSDQAQLFGQVPLPPQQAPLLQLRGLACEGRSRRQNSGDAPRTGSTSSVVRRRVRPHSGKPSMNVKGHAAFEGRQP